MKRAAERGQAERAKTSVAEWRDFERLFYYDAALVSREDTVGKIDSGSSPIASRSHIFRS